MNELITVWKIVPLWFSSILMEKKNLKWSADGLKMEVYFSIFAEKLWTLIVLHVTAFSLYIVSLEKHLRAWLDWWVQIKSKPKWIVGILDFHSHLGYNLYIPLRKLKGFNAWGCLVFLNNLSYFLTVFLLFYLNEKKSHCKCCLGHFQYNISAGITVMWHIVLI